MKKLRFIHRMCDFFFVERGCAVSAKYRSAWSGNARTSCCSRLPWFFGLPLACSEESGQLFALAVSEYELEHHGSATTVPMQSYFANRTGRSLVVLPSPMLPQFHSICVRSQHCCTHICNCMTAQVSCMHLPKVVGTGHCSASAHYNSSST